MAFAEFQASFIAAHDPTRSGNLSMEKKREIVYEISNWSHDAASEALQSWSRQEILQILCVEMGKERKYTGLTKLKMIEHLLKIVSEKKSGAHVTTDLVSQSSPATDQRTTKRQRKIEQPSRVPVVANNLSVNNVSIDLVNVVYCKNSACRATLSQVDAFCKRCSCCICYQYDDNKDPSLWLICSSEIPFQGDSCGLSCHLECALKHNRSGIGKMGEHGVLDGSFYCVSCGKMNDLLRCLRKQLSMAKETRRVDILCYRISLSQKLLKGTQRYQKLSEIVGEAVEKLEVEVGPLTGLPVKMGRGIVNRLSSGPEVQKLCASAVGFLDSLLCNATVLPAFNPLIEEPFSDKISSAPKMIKFEDVCATSITVILGSEDTPAESNIAYSVWHCKAHDSIYPVEPTCTLVASNTRFVVSGLSPATEYRFKVASFGGSMELHSCEVQLSTCTTSTCDEVPNCSVLEISQSPATNCSSLSNPSSVEDETNNITPFSHHADNRADNYLTNHKNAEKVVCSNLSNCAINCNGTGVGENRTGAAALLNEKHALGTVGFVSGADVLKCSNKNSPEGLSTDNGSNSPIPTGLECVPFVSSSEASLPITPCKLDVLKDGLGRNSRSKSSVKYLENGTQRKEEPQDGSTSKKRIGERPDEECVANGVANRDFEYYVKVIRWLECEGHIEKNFRQKFLTWYSLRATPQEVQIVKVYVDTFIEDPAALAGQLMDTFSEIISSRRLSVVPAGFCMKLWH